MPENDVSEILIRPVRKDDLDALVHVEEVCFYDSWNRHMLEQSLGSEFEFLFAAVKKGQVIGYLSMLKSVGEAELLRIAVLPQYRSQGISKLLMQTLLSEAEKDGDESIFLEVRESNAPAIALYLSSGFEKTGLRKNYYKNPEGMNPPREHALLMSCGLKHS